MGSSSSSRPNPEERVGQSQSPIINGALDKSHPAVVALILGKDSYEGACSGTIVKTDPVTHVGWVATAAHCLDVGVSVVVQGEDHGGADVIPYGVIDYESDVRYPASRDHDFAMIRIAGVGESTPVIPLATAPDGLVKGAKVTSVGFGTTNVEGTSNNTQRNAIEKTLNEVTPELLGYNQATSGVCYGDSGGPVISGTGANARVVGIHSFVAGGCDYEGFSARVTNGLDFFDKALAKALPPPSCDLCQKIANSGTSQCASLITWCLADYDCRGYYECIGDPKKDAEKCFTEFPLAEGPFKASKSCSCGQACADQCAGAPACSGIAKCGHNLVAEPTCVSCIEASCCQEELDCTADGRCNVCLKRDDTLSTCKTNERRQKLAACANEKCTTECAGATIQTIGVTPEQPDAGAPPPAPTTDDGCSVTSAKVVSGFSAHAFALPALALALMLRRRQRKRR